MTPICLRDLTGEERARIQRLAHAHTAPAQRVQRAQIIWHASRGESASAIAARLGLDGETVRKRIRRFNAEGLEALKDRHRSGRRPTYTPEQTATVIVTALTKPETLGLPYRVTKLADLTRPVMRAAAGLRRHGARWLAGEERENLVPSQLLAEQDHAGGISPMRLKDILRQV